MNKDRSIFSLSDSLVIIACASARRNHISNEDIEDCAVTFVEHVLRKETEQPDTQGPRTLAYWKQAADNWAKNYLRDTGRQRRREIEWPRIQDEDGNIFSLDPSDGQPGLETETLRQELQRLIGKALEELKPAQKELFIRRVLNGEALQYLATETGRTPEAVRKVVSRACAQLRSYLERHGFRDEDADEYLSFLSPPSSQMLRLQYNRSPED